jgi:deazaflavin-dependent oxidoreductase (nitroreductase family)
MSGDGQRRYQQPGWFTTHVLNRVVAGMVKLGVGFRGSRVLEVKGRTSGVVRRTPVNLLTLDGHEYLVSPRGEGQWVRNVRAAGDLTLVVGRQRVHYSAAEVSDDEHKVVILRAYLKRWKAEVGRFFDGVGPEADDADVAAIAHNHPVFALHEA